MTPTPDSDPVRALADQHFPPELPSVWTGSAIPERKARNARVSHGLPDDAELLVLYDDTLFGGGGDGFVITADRFSFKELLESPRAVRWTDLSSEDVRVDETVVHVGGLAVRFSTWTAAHAEHLGAFLREVTGGNRLPRRWTDTAFLATVRKRLGHDDHVFFAPSIPPKKLSNARAFYGIPEEESLLVLFDDTVFGGAKVGWVMTPRRWAFCETFGTPGQLAWQDVFAAEVVQDANRLRCGPVSYEPLQARRIPDLMAAFADLRALGAEELEPRNPELDARIAADPEDDAAFAVYADWLLEQGHPRGQAATAVGEFLEPILERYGPELGVLLPRDDLVLLDWRWGFWDTVELFTTIEPEVFDQIEVYAVARQILQHPSARFLRTLHLGSASHPLPAGHLEPVLRALSEAALPCLQELEIHGGPRSFVSDTLRPQRWKHLQSARLDVHRVDPGVERHVSGLTAG